MRGLIRRVGGPGLAAVVLLLVTGAALAGCGNSSTSSSERTSGASTTTVSTSSSTATESKATESKAKSRGEKEPTMSTAEAHRRVREGLREVRKCVQKNVIALRKTKSGAKALGGKVASEITAAEYQAIGKRCGGDGSVGLRRVAPKAIFKSPTFKRATRKFAECMRENGVTLPPENTSGKGPLFDTQGLSGEKFRTAETKCAAVLRSPVTNNAKAKKEAGSAGAG
jgi:hypothetical protein